MLGRKPRPRSYRALIVEHGAKPGPVARAQAAVIVTEQKPGRWRVTKNKTGKTLTLKP